MNKKKTLSDKPERPDYWLLCAALLLACFGLMMVLSASGIMAERFFGDKYLFFKKQGIFLVGGIIMMYISSRLPKAVFYNMVYVWLMGAFILLLLCDFTPLSVAAGGATRWIALGPIRIQPLEFCKPALVLYLAYFFSRKQELIKTFSVGFLPPFAITGALCLLLMLQPDFGGSVFLCMILFFMSLVGGTRVSYLLTSLFFAGGAGYMLITSSPYRLKRMTAFIDPFKSAHEEGYQLVQSLYAFGSGNIFGQGLGAGKQKLFFLPEAHNDFIMAVVGEELGFIGVLAVFMVVAFLVWRGFRIALAQEDLQDRFTAYGLTIMLALGFVLNLAVVMGTVPPKGVPMPFVSYGGSSLLISCTCIGILLNLSRGKV
ncbi:putative lipid II flippase FtsW [Maridesulfovibrio sp. FT414]|uniref:putative lipid II flippase FtsW n=1 Tax=Maridesulfovibrio sp. FT414 TaxID=2979469 RepID=UPI003D80573A